MDKAINWRAIGIGVAVGVGGSLLVQILFRVFPFDASERPMWAFYLLSYGTGIAVDVATGASAGWIARGRGAVHGLLAGVFTGVIAPVVGLAIVWVETRGEIPFGLVSYLGWTGVGGVIGIALATAAGAVAARLASAEAAGRA